MSRNHLDLTTPERTKLRASGMKVKEIHHHSVKELQTLLQVPKIRAMELYALSEFQSLPSIGIRFAYDLVSMGYYSLQQLKGKDGAKLIDQFESQVGAWADPCLEDQFRLVVHYANNPGSHKNWWDFTSERKAYREKYGYPSSRPKQPWFNLPEYQVQDSLPAKKQVTRTDLHSKLRNAIRVMKKDLSKELTLEQLADASSLSSYHFLRSFKSAYEKTPFQYLTHLRLKKSCELLRKTKLPINAVMVKCGFQNESSFIRLFKRNLKTTPATFRKGYVNGVG